MKKTLLFWLILSNTIAFSQAPFGNYLTIAPGHYAANADTLAPFGANHFPEFSPTDTFTIEFYHKNNPGSQTVSSLVAFGPGLYMHEMSGYFMEHEYFSTVYQTFLNGAFDPIEIYDWNHVVMEFIPYLNNTHRCFLASNGVSGGFADIDDDDFSNTFGTNRDVFIGATYPGYFFMLNDPNSFLGTIDEFRISSTSRYHLDINGLGYTVPTTEFTPDASTICLLHFNGSPTDSIIQDASANNRDFIMVRNNFMPDTSGIYTISGFVNADTLCYEDQIFLAGGDQFHWQPSFGISDTSSSSPTILLTDTTITYFVTITNSALSYSFTDSITITVQANIDLGSDTVACPGVTNITLNIDSSYTDVYWTPDYIPGYSFNIDSSGTYGAIANFNTGCFTYDEINVSFIQDYYIEGTAYKNDSTPLINTKIYFLNADTENVVLNIDSTLTNASGIYNKNISFTPFYILLSPDSAVYPDQLPVYYDTSLFIQNATNITMLCDTLDADLYAKLGVNPGGPCITGGTVVYNGRAVNGDPVQHLKIILMNSANQPIAYTFTNDTGYFSFDNLAAGNIKFYVDYMGVNNLIAPEINLSTLQDFSQLQFELFPDQLILLGTPSVSVQENNDLELVNIYPNPAHDRVYLKNQILENISFQIYDSYGRNLFSGISNDGGYIDISNLNNGIYYIKLITNSGQKTLKFMKN